ncbi:MAG TPA: 50S ribosomal protein L10 [Chitinophagaceae bacterium]|nr:50S ribosomal protein L10 [Chitinophagaceae bacterium]
MKPAEKREAIELLKEKFGQYNNFYITNTESLSVAQITEIRSACYDKDVEMRVAKNTLIRKALESLNNELYPELYDSLKGVTALMFSDSAKEPAVILSDFRKKNPGDKPFLKAALIGEEVFIGDENLNTLKNIKSKEELIGEVITLLQSPISRVVSALTQKAEKDAEGGEEVAEETSEE